MTPTGTKAGPVTGPGFSTILRAEDLADAWIMNKRVRASLNTSLTSLVLVS